jgi:hypothetical protein
MVPSSSAGVAPYVSIVVTGRNDGYGGDFVKRFLATLQFNHRELAARGVTHEFVVVEWAPPRGAPLLADLVDARCPASLAATVRAIVVDEAYQSPRDGAKSAARVSRVPGEECRYTTRPRPVRADDEL